ncbi:carboxypeptidase-like regulatory domain-containing protein [Nitrospina sp. 32_T5]|uniref:carboxypeptidase-like regulatory domain-containing protein n=1 Tax=unclassified Nitrospina TaxID=2638683 RepID=UPI003F9C34F1
MKTQMLPTLAGAMALWLATGTGLAQAKGYEAIDVKNGGTLTGTVLFKGTPPDPIMEDLSKGKNAEFCAQHPDATKDGMRPRQKVQVTDGKLNGAVVFIQNIDKGKDWNAEIIQFDFKDCDIFPKVSVVRRPPRGVREGLVQIVNQDPDILHNPHGYAVKGAQRKTLFNKPLPSKGDVADVTKNLMRMRPGRDQHFFLQCDQHNFMEADARVVWNPYYAVTGKDGAFTLDQVPAGTYKITAWHPYVGEVTKEVTVGADGTANLDFELTSK